MWFAPNQKGLIFPVQPCAAGYHAAAMFGFDEVAVRSALTVLLALGQAAGWHRREPGRGSALAAGVVVGRRPDSADGCGGGGVREQKSPQEHRRAAEGHRLGLPVRSRGFGSVSVQASR